MEKLLTSTEVQEILGISPTTLWRYKEKGLFPIKVGRQNKYKKEDLEEFIERQKEYTYRD